MSRVQAFLAMRPTAALDGNMAGQSSDAGHGGDGSESPVNYLQGSKGYLDGLKAAGLPVNDGLESLGDTSRGSGLADPAPVIVGRRPFTADEIREISQRADASMASTQADNRSTTISQNFWMGTDITIDQSSLSSPMNTSPIESKDIDPAIESEMQRIKSHSRAKPLDGSIGGFDVDKAAQYMTQHLKQPGSDRFAV
jgi:hypothetical protein